MEITYQLIKELSDKNGFPFFTGENNINIFGLRNSEKVVNLFNDIIGIAYQDENLQEQCLFWHGSTKPGLFYLGDKMMNPNGTFILAPGFYPRCWQIGIHHKQYEALVQYGNIFKGWRDKDKDSQLDYTGALTNDVAGLNLHTTSYKTDQEKVGAWSAGCQIIQDDKDFDLLMTYVHKSAALYGNKFSYKLFQL